MNGFQIVSEALRFVRRYGPVTVSKLNKRRKARSGNTKSRKKYKKRIKRKAPSYVNRLDDAAMKTVKDKKSEDD